MSQCANNMGDQLIFDSNTPGGTSFQGHTTNTTTLQKIQLGSWDFVALQEQSQRPAFPDAQVATQVFPYAAELNDMILEYSPCAETIFYMTWGRKNGDSQNCATWPPVCTYEGMDSLLHLRYMQMAEQNDAIVSPVGAVWRYLRENHSSIELYNADESHPSYAGSYAAALSFYTVIFRKNPALITWNGTLTASEAQTIRNAVKTIVFDQLTTWFVGTYDTLANFQYNNSSTFDYTFTNTSSNFDSNTWYVDGVVVSNDVDLAHTFSITGPHQVKLVVQRCGVTSVREETVLVGFMGMEPTTEPQIRVYPNPVVDMLYLENVVDSEVRVFDMLGRLVMFETKNNPLNLNQLSKGMYLVEVLGRTIRIEKI